MTELSCGRYERRLRAARDRTEQANAQLASLQNESCKLHDFMSSDPLALQRRADWLQSLDGALAELQGQVDRLSADELVHRLALGEARAQQQAYEKMHNAAKSYERKASQRRARAQAPTSLGKSTTLRVDHLEIDNDDTFGSF